MSSAGTLAPVPAWSGRHGLESFAVVYGEKIEIPLFATMKGTAKATRLSKPLKAAGNIAAKRVVQIFTTHANRRRDFTNKLSRQLVNGYSASL